jgi:predicted ATPase
VEYIFKHALTQEVAYNSVLQEHRKTLHEQTAQAIETLYSATLEEYYNELAHHYTRSGNTEKAIQYLQLAGSQAVQHFAYVEAIQQYSTALELLQTLPDIPNRLQQEFALQTALGVPLMTTLGWGAPQVERAYVRAYELSKQLGEPSQRFLALRGLWECYELQGKLPEARGIAEQLFSLARVVKDPTLLLVAHCALLDNLFWKANMARF